MSDIELIKRLRSETGLSFMLCKQAVIESDGDYDVAKKYLEEKGINSSQKKKNNQADLSAFVFRSSGKVAIVFEIFLQSDFVLKNEEFQAAFSKLIDFAFVNHKLFHTVEDFYSLDFEGNKVSNFIDYIIAKIGENIGIRGISKYYAEDRQIIGGYVYPLQGIPNDIGIGTLMSVVTLSVDSEDDGVESSDKIVKLSNNLAKQVVAFDPKYISIDKIPEVELQNIKDSFDIELGKKPKDIEEKIILGKLNKVYSECVLLKQSFILDQDQSVEGLIEKYSVDLNAKIEVLFFKRFS